MKDKIKKLIEEDKQLEAYKVILENFAIDDETMNELALIKARMTRNESKNWVAIIHPEDYNRERNQINKVLLDIVSNLKSKDQYKEEKLKSNLEMKILDVLSERFKLKLEALDELDRLIWEFNHEFEFYIIGRPNQAAFDEFYFGSRRHARSSKGIIGENGELISVLIREITDLGRELINANFKITKDSIEFLKNRNLPDQIINHLLKKIEENPTKVSLLLEGISDPISYSQEIFRSLKPTSEITFDKYFAKMDSYKEVIRDSRYPSSILTKMRFKNLDQT